MATVRRIAVILATAAMVAVSLLCTGAAANSAPAPRLAAARVVTPECTAAQLGVWVATDQLNGAAGTFFYPLEFTNISRRTCVLFGFPGVSVLGPNGQELGAPAAWDHTVRARTVRLAPSATAYALLAYVNAVASNCAPANRVNGVTLRVFPPDQRQAVHAFWSLPECNTSQAANFLRVRVIVAGVGVRGDFG